VMAWVRKEHSHRSDLMLDADLKIERKK